ncbi:MAG: hypothetical protein ACRCYO_10230 [Bacteroidia bacterium]
MHVYAASERTNQPNWSCPKVRLAFRLWAVGILLPFFLQAQTRDSLVGQGIQQLTALWIQSNGYAMSSRPDAPLAQAAQLYDRQLPDTSRAPYSQRVLEIRRQQFASDKGLVVNGNYIENFGVGPTGEDDLIYRRRIQAGLEWNLLDGGLYENRSKIDQIDNQIQIAQLKQQMAVSSDGRLQTYNTLIYAFNLHKVELLKQRRELCQKKLRVVYDLYAQHAIAYTEVLEAQQQQADIDALLRLYAGYNEQLKAIINDSLFPKDPLPVFDIDSRMLFAASGSTVSGDSINQLILENLAIDQKRINDMRLSVSLRYNYYDPTIVTADSRNFFSAGVNFSMPLYFGRAETERLIDAQRVELQQQQTQSSNERAFHLANLLYTFRYKLKQYESFQEKRRQFVELIRIERVKQQFGDLEFNPVTALNLLDQLMQIDVELLDIRQQLYLSLLDIMLDVPGVPVSSYLIPYTPQALVQPLRAYDRSIYIWSKSSEKHTAGFITNSLRTNSFSTAIVSAGGTKASHQRTRVLMDSLKRAGIKMELLIGENKLLTRKNPAAYLDSLLFALGNPAITAIHLDVEPHTFADWDKNKTTYLDQYIVMVEAIRTFCNGKNLQLTVSIPVFYPSDFLARLYPLVDRVYIMAYEQTNADKVVAKTSEERALSAEKTIIAIRTKDFATRESFDDFLLLLAEKIKLPGIAVHDFETLQELDAKKKDN